MAVMTVESRQQLLDRKVAEYIRQGYLLTARSDTTAQLVKPKKFSLFWALFWLFITFFVFGLGFVVYWIWHANKKNKSVYLEVDANGTIKTIAGTSTD